LRPLLEKTEESRSLTVLAANGLRTTRDDKIERLAARLKPRPFKADF
jgi:hypothetical protein